MKRRNLAIVSMISFATLTSLACSTATPTGTPGVSRLGENVLQYKGPEVEALLSSRFANSNLGSPWLLLDLLVTGANRVAIEIKRDQVSIRIPDGTIVPLPSQREFSEAYSELRAADIRADVAADPLAYYTDRRLASLNFLVVPGSGLSFDSIWVNDLRMALGRLYFPMPRDVQAGRYELRIDLPESKVRIPFSLGTPAR